MILRYFIFLVIGTSAMATVEKRCYTSSPPLDPSQLLLSSNSETPAGTQALNDLAAVGKLSIVSLQGASIGFQVNPLKKGDCLLANPREARTWEVSQEGQSAQRRNFIPVVYFRHDDDAKLFGLLDSATWLILTPQKQTDTPTARIEDYRGRGANDLLILYVLCPPKRDSACELTIKKQGRWVRDGKGKKFRLPVFARAAREAGEPKESLRLHVNGDTPQGIYYVWASMFSGRRFGGEPRVDIDSAMPPVNVFRYDVNSFVLSQLIPDSSRGDYWVNEWPLAYKLGRAHLRLHAQSGDDVETAGCINTGAHTRRLLQKLQELGVFRKGSLANTDSDPATLGWKVSPLIGRAFLIVKDRDE